MDILFDNLAFGLLIVLALFVLIGAASGLSAAHADERKACLKAGYEWSATKYVCVVKPNK